MTMFMLRMHVLHLRVALEKSISFGPHTFNLHTALLCLSHKCEQQK